MNLSSLHPPIPSPTAAILGAKSLISSGREKEKEQDQEWHWEHGGQEEATKYRCAFARCST